MTSITNIPPVFCPQCNCKAHRQNTKYGVRDDCWQCNLHSWNGKPLTTSETLKARSLAHSSFDRLWREDKLVARSRAYIMLAEVLGLTRDSCHISLFDLSTARKVPEAVDVIRERLSLRTREEETRDRKERKKEMRNSRLKYLDLPGKQTTGTADTKLAEQLKSHPFAVKNDIDELKRGNDLKLPFVDKMPEDSPSTVLQSDAGLDDDIELF